MNTENDPKTLLKLMKEVNKTILDITNTQVAFDEGERQAAEADSGSRPLSPYQSDEMTKAFFHGFDSYFHHKVMDEIDNHHLDLEAADERDEELKRTEDNSDPLTTTIEDTYNEQ